MCHSEIVSSISSAPASARSQRTHSPDSGTPTAPRALLPTSPANLPSLRQASKGLARSIREVWAWNFEKEFSAFLALAVSLGAEAIISFDAEFPTSNFSIPSGDRSERHRTLCECLDAFWPIQLGFSLGSAKGESFGTWSFNLMFETEVDLDTQAGINPFVIGQRIAKSSLVGCRLTAPTWLTFCGNLDIGYLLKLLLGQHVPKEVESYDEKLLATLPRRMDLQDLHDQDLNHLLTSNGIGRCGEPQTAGSNALATLDKFLCMPNAVDLPCNSPKVLLDGPSSAASTAPEVKRSGVARNLRQVWGWNFDKEFSAFLTLVASLGADAIIAFDAEFPESKRQTCSSASRLERHATLCECLNDFWPIQLGFALADAEGTFHGAWSFNLMFEMDEDLGTQAGINPFVIGQRIAKSSLIGHSLVAPLWLTFGGSLDVGYLVKILTGQHIPKRQDEYDDQVLSSLPRRLDLQDLLQGRNLNDVLTSNGICRHGSSPTAGDNALVALELHLSVKPVFDALDNSIPRPSDCASNVLDGMYELQYDLGLANEKAGILNGPPSCLGLASSVREVWAWNFEQEFSTFLSLAISLGADAIIAFVAECIALDSEILASGDPTERHTGLCEFLDAFWHTQLGFALADSKGRMYGAWSFNLMFEVEEDLSTKAGINPFVIGQRIANSSLVGSSATAPLWLSFGAELDAAYLMKIFTGKPLPRRLDVFDNELVCALPRLMDLQDLLPNEDLDCILSIYGLERCGPELGAGSKALAATELQLCLASYSNNLASNDIELGENDEPELIADDFSDSMQSSDSRYNRWVDIDTDEFYVSELCAGRCREIHQVC